MGHLNHSYVELPKFLHLISPKNLGPYPPTLFMTCIRATPATGVTTIVTVIKVHMPSSSASQQRKISNSTIRDGAKHRPDQGTQICLVLFFWVVVVV